MRHLRGVYFSHNREGTLSEGGFWLEMQRGVRGNLWPRFLSTTAPIARHFVCPLLLQWSCHSKSVVNTIVFNVCHPGAARRISRRPAKITTAAFSHWLLAFSL